MLNQLTSKRNTAVVPKTDTSGVGLSIASFKRRRMTLARGTFLCLVVIPTLLGAIYCFMFMKDRYVAEASFLVRGVSNQQATGLSSVFRTFGISRADDDSFAVENYLQSRDAVRLLEARVPLRSFYSQETIDPLSRFPYPWESDSFESLYDYFQSRVSVIRNSATGITVLRVTAFSGAAAAEIAKNLLAMSEELVNKMNVRSQQDSIVHARNFLRDAEKRVLDAQGQLTAFRNRELLVDPSLNSTKTLDVIGQLAMDLARTQTQLTEMRSGSPSSPAIPAFRARIEALQNEIASEKSKLAGGDGALAGKISTYEQLVLSREFADRELAGAWAAMQGVQQEARRQQIYLETISGPVVPDEPIEPRRFRIVLTILAFSSAIFAMSWFLFSAAKEHVYG
jgi:capsular polysaccharide transport system permease protein